MGGGRQCVVNIVMPSDSLRGDGGGGRQTLIIALFTPAPDSIWEGGFGA
jgi:hypothetical protein